MKIEKLKKDNRKKIIIGVAITILLFMGVVGFIGTRAKYKYTAEYPLVSGAIHYKSGDLSVVAVNIENDSGEFTESDNIPSEGYILNLEKSYCGLSNGDGTYTNENAILIYNDGAMTFSNITKKGTKCFLYFNKPNYLVASKTGEEAANDVLGKELARSSFESIITLDSKNVPSNAIESWDASQKHNGSIMAWYTDTNNNGLYELYIGQDGGVIANPNSAWLFSGYTNVSNMDLSNFNTSNITNMVAMFAYVASLTNLDLSNFDTSNVTTMQSMFYNMTSLTNLNLSSFNTSNVTDMLAMFYQTGLVSLDLSNFDTSNVVNMSSMFAGMTSLTNLNINSFDTSKVADMSWMFFSSTSLMSLDLSNFNTLNVTNIGGMFNCTAKLETLYLNNFDFTNVEAYDAIADDGTVHKFIEYTNIQNVYVKDINAKNFISARLSEVGKTATVTIG